jgi:hypothetical protein
VSAALRRTAGWPAAAVLVAVVILAAGIGQTSAGHAALRAAGLYSAPGGYTSLAFVHPRSVLPSSVTNRARLRVAFAIQNADSDKRDYQWSVSLVQPGGSRRVADGHAAVGSGREAAITASVPVLCAAGALEVVVRLVRPAEAIDARTKCQSAGAR